jgi:hypothetical protein
LPRDFLRVSREGLSVSEIPITLNDRKTGKSSKGLIRYGIGVSKAILYTFFHMKKQETFK